ncbi:FAD-binding oxidoreductase [Mycobacterium sp. URHB0021]
MVSAAHADDVVAAVRWASSNGLRVAVQATGHGAVPYGEDVLLIHTGRLRRCNISLDEHTAKVGAGVSSQQLIDASAPFGLAPLVGTAGDVGFVGFLSGGGIGAMAATFGLSSDSVRSLDVVSGQGEKYHVTQSEHADLFWGLRGSKTTLGIITEVEIELPFLPTFYGGALYFDGADFSQVLREWSDSLTNVAATALSVLQLPNMPFVAPELAGRLVVVVRIAAAVSLVTAERLLAPIRAVARPIKDTIGARPYSDITSIYDEPTMPMPVQKDLTLLQSLPSEAVDALADTAGPQSRSPMLVVTLRRLGGALASSSAAPSVFSHREAAYMVHTVGLNVPSDPQIVADAGRRIHDALRPWAIDGIFANFVATTNPDRLRTAYNEVSLRRLQAMAQQYDPLGILATVGQLAR